MHEASERPRTPPLRRDRRGHRGVFGAALAASLVVHASMFFVFRFTVDVAPAQAPARVAPLVRVVPAMQAFDIREVAGVTTPIEVQVLERVTPRPVAVPDLPTARVDVPGETPLQPVDLLSVEERLRYRMAAPDVWRAPSEEIVAELSDEEIAHRRIAAQLGEYNDSVAAEAAMRERSMDWTVKDADGGRWGVSPGAIHLGSITIPIGATRFAVAAGRREEFEGRVRTWNEIQVQSARVEASESFKDRVKAIEERKAKERAERKGTSGGTTNSTGNGSKPPGGG